MAARRRGRTSVPPRAAPSGPREAVEAACDEAFEDELQQLKAMVAQMLDRIEASLIDSKTIRPRGGLTMEEIMQRFGRLVYPMVFLKRLRSKAIGIGDNEKLNFKKSPKTDSFYRSISSAIEAEEELNAELRIDLGMGSTLQKFYYCMNDPGRLLSTFYQLELDTARARDTFSIGFDTLVDIKTAVRAGSFSVERVLKDTIDPSVYTVHYDGTHAFVFKANPDSPDFVILSTHAHTLDDDAICMACKQVGLTLANHTEDSDETTANGILFSDDRSGMLCIASSALDDLHASVSAATVFRGHACETDEPLWQEIPVYTHDDFDWV